MEKETKKLPQRKKIRLQGYDYSTAGAYFITICTQNHRKIFWETVGADIIRPNEIKLSKYGLLVETAIKNISEHYENMVVDKYCIMPDHIHLLISSTDGRMISAPTMSRAIGQMKRWVSKHAGSSFWQKSYFDHIIRNENDYRENWEYIDRNPQTWIDKHNNQAEKLEYSKLF